jgi:hypothetical protein
MFISALQVECCDGTSTQADTSSKHFLPNWLFINDIKIRHYVVWAAAIVGKWTVK